MEPQSVTEIRTAKAGVPFCKNILEIFGTLMTSLQLKTHKQYFRSYPNSFTADEAYKTLFSVHFTSSYREASPADSDHIVTSTRTTSFNLNREMTMVVLQHFMDARLIEKTSNPLHATTVLRITPKGLYILEEFISKNGMSRERLEQVFRTQPVCTKLFYLERSTADDEIVVSPQVVTALFCRLVGRTPNYVDEQSSGDADPTTEYTKRAAGILLFDFVEKATRKVGERPSQTFRYCFKSADAIDWLCDFTSMIRREEALDLAVNFVRQGFITLVHDRRRPLNAAGFTTGTSVSNTTQGEFTSAKAIYRITKEGGKAAGWTEPDAAYLGSTTPKGTVTAYEPTAQASAPPSDSANTVTDVTAEPGSSAQLSGTLEETTEQTATQHSNPSEQPVPGPIAKGKEPSSRRSNSEELRFVLNEPALRSLFQEFEYSNMGSDYVPFWLEVEEQKRHFGTMSTSIVGERVSSDAVAEEHRKSLVQKAFRIYEKYLFPDSYNELNIDLELRREVILYLDKVLADLTGETDNQGHITLERAYSLTVDQFSHLLRLYEKIQRHVFLLLAVDLLPKVDCLHGQNAI
ncbi:hypothetical protein FRC17_006125 [Serendipita sp. 399]|nr:hypothetical protein FRC17_006125 [Serendipita sp. 399]